jgi:hypothetical protein
MPQTVNGFGTTLYAGRGDVGFGGADSVIWVVAAYAPLIPLSCVHTFNWNGNQYQAVPLRWSWVLVLRSFLAGWRGWLLVFGIIAVVVCLMALFLGPENNPGEVSSKYTFVTIMAAAAAVLLPLAGLTHLWLLVTDGRTNDLRRVLGPHDLGSADPALLARPPTPDAQRDFGAATFAEAAEQALQQGQFVRAMWAARFATVLEDAQTGEQLTDAILEHPDVVEALAVVRRKPGSWAEALKPADDETVES